MTEIPKSESVYSPALERPKQTLLASCLSYLVFQGEHIRIGLEITSCILLALLLEITIPWGYFGFSVQWVALASWMSACTMMGICDLGLFHRPLTVFRKARSLDIDGAYDKALAVLESIGPASNSLISFPLVRYHLERTRFLTHALRFQDAEVELELAKGSGLGVADYHLTRFLLHKEQDQCELALTELNAARAAYGENTIFLAEEALLFIEINKDYRAAQRLLKTALGTIKATERDASMLRFIIGGYFEVTRLWTGEAEEGLEGLSGAIYHGKSLAMSYRELRPYVAFLLLERAYYFAGHREPDEAIRDTKVANHLCAYPRIQKRTAEIKHELQWRYNITF